MFQFLFQKLKFYSEQLLLCLINVMFRVVKRVLCRLLPTSTPPTPHHSRCLYHRSSTSLPCRRRRWPALLVPLLSSSRTCRCPSSSQGCSPWIRTLVLLRRRSGLLSAFILSFLPAGMKLVGSSMEAATSSLLHPYHSSPPLQRPWPHPSDSKIEDQFQ